MFRRAWSTASFLFLRAFTFSYHWSLHNYTLEPIQEITLHQGNLLKRRMLLRDFKIRKEQEVQFIRTAVCHSSIDAAPSYVVPSVGDSMCVYDSLIQYFVTA